ncbi:thioredoxin domain-containing protein [Arthrobacter sp. Sa2BUA2]|uniref:Thioredoxin domain-containing protein n=1 Tax=Arthrobacter pullicola TaxID=2762224 RepID=A0ABR8YM70_9MICC|nr:thioredoxin domain-containing protein [Arthrobacter pullicola]MBD8045346.1 thioredoxin domain-containing protein [Arthrobacter pullicola]
MRRTVPSLVIASVLALGGVASCAAPESAPETTATASAAPTFSAEQLDIVAPADARAITNPADPKATLVLFTDYECPYCAKMDALIQQAAEDYGDEVRILVRNYPLSKHLNAEPAAQAVEAAAEQGALQDMAATIFEHQEDWAAEIDPDDIFAQYAEDLGLDVEKFRADYSSEAIKARVAKDLADAKALQVKGTPTLILDGQMLQLNSVDYAELQEPLDEAVAN